MSGRGTRFLAGTLAALCSAGVAAVLVDRWWPPVQEGIDALGWPSAPAQIVFASFRSEYDAEAAHGRNQEIRNEFTDIRVAFWAPAGDAAERPYTASRFDTATGWLAMPGPLAGMAHEVRHVLGQGERLRVRHDPADPARSVIVAGPPWSAVVLMGLPVALIGLAITFLRWAAGGRARTTFASPIVFLFGAAVLGGLLPALWMALFDVMLPWWILPGAYAVCLAGFALPVMLRYPPMREVMTVLVLAVPVVGIGGVSVLAMGDHRAAFGTQWSDAELIERLAAKHPAIAEDAAWRVMRRNGPRGAAPALTALLRADSLDVRRAAAAALTRIGPAALVAVDAVDAAFDAPENASIRETLERTRTHLRGYLWAKAQVRKLRDQLLHAEDGQSRNGAAFSLGQLGELAVVSIPDLEQAARDPRNASFADHMEGVIASLRRYRSATD